MTVMNRHSNGKNRKLTLDPRLDKELYKEKITSTIMDQVKGALREEVYREADKDYERLLLGASVTPHIPVLVEGEVRAEERRKIRSH